MNKENALEIANDFIYENITNNNGQLDLNKPFETILSKGILEDDPGLKILKTELKKVGYQISQGDNEFHYIVSKISK